MMERRPRTGCCFFDTLYHNLYHHNLVCPVICKCGRLSFGTWKRFLVRVVVVAVRGGSLLGQKLCLLMNSGEGWRMMNLASEAGSKPGGNLMVLFKAYYDLLPHSRSLWDRRRSQKIAKNRKESQRIAKDFVELHRGRTIDESSTVINSGLCVSAIQKAAKTNKFLSDRKMFPF